MSDTETLIKIARLPDILKAASLLKFCNLIDEQPADVVKRYVNANPDVNVFMNKVSK